MKELEIAEEPLYVFQPTSGKFKSPINKRFSDLSNEYK